MSSSLHFFGGFEEQAKDIARYDFSEHRARSFLAFQFDKIIKPLARTMADNVIGEGLRIRPVPIPAITGQSPDVSETWGRTVEARFRIWAEAHKFYATQYSAFMSMKVLGDCPIFFILDGDDLVPAAYDNYIIDPSEHNDGFVSGVKADKFNRVVAISLRDAYDQTARVVQAESGGIRNFVLLRKIEIAGQVRGVPAFSAMSSMTRNFNNFFENEVRASRIRSTIVGVASSDSAGLNASGIGASRNVEKTETGETTYSIGEDGTSVFVKTRENEKLDMWDTNRKSPELAEFTKTLYEVAAAMEGWPASLVMKKFERSYSASRGEINEAERVIRIERQRMKSDFLSPFFREWLQHEILAGRIEAPGYLDSDESVKKAWANIEVVGPRREGLDAVKDARAEEIAISNLLVSRKTIAEGKGLDYDSELERIREEMEFFENEKNEDAKI